MLQFASALVNSARGLVKSMGERLPACSTESLGEEQWKTLPEKMRATLEPLFEVVAELSEKIQACDETLEQMARNDYPETKLLKQVSGVGTLVALTFVLTENRTSTLSPGLTRG